MNEDERKSPPCSETLKNPSMPVDAESVRMAMDQAWADHHHARDQTWKALQIEAVLAAGLIGIDIQIDIPIITVAAGFLVILATLFGIFITFRHRDVEVRKITHIFNCEQFLGLHREDLICDVGVPKKVTILDIFLFWRMNTSLFLLRMHVAIIIFAAFFIWVRWSW